MSDARGALVQVETATVKEVVVHIRPLPGVNAQQKQLRSAEEETLLSERPARSMPLLAIGAYDPLHG
jgi:hypothetical protein